MGDKIVILFIYSEPLVDSKNDGKSQLNTWKIQNELQDILKNRDDNELIAIPAIFKIIRYHFKEKKPTIIHYVGNNPGDSQCIVLEDESGKPIINSNNETW
jgi:hypothetical protein